MKRASSQLWFLLLLTVMAAWIVGLFTLPSLSWLRLFGQGPVEILSGPFSVPGMKDGKAVRRRVARIDLAEETNHLLTLTAEPGGEFRLKARDRTTGNVMSVRFSERTRRTKILLPFQAKEYPHKLAVSIQSLDYGDVHFAGLQIQGLHSGYRWLPPVYRLIGPLLLVVVATRHRRNLVRYLRGQDSSRSTAWPRWDGRAATLVFLFCFTVFRWAPVHQILDSKYISVISHSLITSGSLAFPSDFSPNAPGRRDYRVQRVGDGKYPYYSAAPAVLNAPFVAYFELRGISSLGSSGQFSVANERRVFRFIAAFLAAALCAVLFLLARVWLPPGSAVVLTLVFAFGSQIFSTISRPFWSHSWATLLLAVSLLLMSAPRFKDRRWVYGLISTLLCWAYFCRPTLSLSIVGVALLLLFTRRRHLPTFVATGLLWASLFVLHSVQTWGTWLPPYFGSAHVQSGRLAVRTLWRSYPEAVWGTLLSPARGLFIYVPILVLVLLVVIRRWRWLPDKGLALTALGVCIAHWQLVSMFRDWTGGQSYGPRLMADLVPWFFLLAALGLRALRSAQAEGCFHWTPLKRTLVVVFVAASVFINARGAFEREAQHHSGLWNWRYPQFMKGL